MATDIIAQGLAAAALNKALPLRTTPVRIVTFGDSTANTTDTRDVANQDTSQISFSTWQSGTKSIAIASNKWMTDAFYPMAYRVGNCGISGQTTTQMVARDGLAASITRRAIQDAIDLNPDCVIYRGGSINDFQSISSGTLAAAVATAYANAQEIVFRFLQAGIPVIICGIYGYSGIDGVTFPASNALIRQAIVAQNANLNGLAAANPTMVRYVDPVGAVSDATGAYLSANYYGAISNADTGIHLTSLGQYIMGQLEAVALTALFGPSSSVRYRGKNLFTDPLFMTTTVQSFGTVANILTITATNATRSNAQIQEFGVKRWQTVDITITAAGSSMQIIPTINFTSTGLNLPNGSLVGLEMDYYIAGLSGYTPTLAVAGGDLLRINNTDSVGSGRVVADVTMCGSYPVVIDRPFQRKITWAPYLIGDSAANLTATTPWIWQFTPPPADTAGTIRIGVANPRVVLLGQNVTTT